MVMVLEANDAVTPAGSPLAVPISVAPVVVWVMLVNGELMQTDGDAEAADTVFVGVTTMVPVALNDPQPPVNGIL